MPLHSVSRDPIHTIPPRPRVYPPRTLLNRGIVAALIFSVPVFGVLYAMVLPDGPWLVVVLTHAAALVLAGLAVIAYFRCAIWIGAESSVVTERGYLGRLSSFDKVDAASILFAEVYTSDGSETNAQLIVLDADERPLLRMRGQYWTRDDIATVSSHFDVPVVMLPNALSAGELRKDYPRALYVFERHPIVLVLLAVAGTALATVFFILGHMLIQAVRG